MQLTIGSIKSLRQVCRNLKKLSDETGRMGILNYYSFYPRPCQQIKLLTFPSFSVQTASQGNIIIIPGNGAVLAGGG